MLQNVVHFFLSWFLDCSWSVLLTIREDDEKKLYKVSSI